MNLLWTLGPTFGSPALSGRRANNAIPRDARTVLLLDKPGRTTLDRVAAYVHEGSALGVLARTTKRSSRSSQRTNPPPTRVNVARCCSQGRSARRSPFRCAVDGRAVVGHRSHLDQPGRGVHRGRRSVAGVGAAIVATDRPGRVASPLCELRPARRRWAIVISEYPAWPPGLQSALLEVVHAAHLEVHGRVPHVTTVHAGLEAGEIAAHLPGLVSRLSQRFRRWVMHFSTCTSRVSEGCICVRHNADAAKSVAECCRRHAASVCDAYASRRTRASRHYVKRQLLTGAHPARGTVCPANPEPLPAAAQLVGTRAPLLGLPKSLVTPTAVRSARS
jgi:hypothetical protein